MAILDNKSDGQCENQSSYMYIQLNIFNTKSGQKICFVLTKFHVRRGKS